MGAVIYLVGGALFIVTMVTAVVVTPNPSLDECAQAHNVYKCEWVAMPVADGKLEIPQ